MLDNWLLEGDLISMYENNTHIYIYIYNTQLEYTLYKYIECYIFICSLLLWDPLNVLNLLFDHKYSHYCYIYINIMDLYDIPNSLAVDFTADALLEPVSFFINNFLFELVFNYYQNILITF